MIADGGCALHSELLLLLIDLKDTERDGWREKTQERERERGEREGERGRWMEERKNGGGREREQGSRGRRDVGEKREEHEQSESVNE